MTIEDEEGDCGGHSIFQMKLQPVAIVNEQAVKKLASPEMPLLRQLIP
jgi:hypothetical protein